MKLAQLGEFGFIERIRKAVSDPDGVRLGIGDDCAATVLPAGELLLTTTDLLIEDVHFRRAWTDMASLGAKSVAVNVSDIAAMGGVPRHLSLGVGVPADLALEDLDAFLGGFLAAAASYGATLIGGDTCRSPGPLLISVTAQGAVPETELVRRSGAAAGDAVFVSGSLGDSALALQRLRDGQGFDTYLAERHHRPRARVELGRALAAQKLATSMIDLSDGLVADLGHILKACGLGACIEAATLPLSSPFRTALAADPALLELALTGGEDYELLFTVAPQRVAELAPLAATTGLALTRIGTLTPKTGLAVVDGAGRPLALQRSGFNHFAPSGG